MQYNVRERQVFLAAAHGIGERNRQRRDWHRFIIVQVMRPGGELLGSFARSTNLRGRFQHEPRFRQQCATGRGAWRSGSSFPSCHA